MSEELIFRASRAKGLLVLVLSNYDAPLDEILGTLTEWRERYGRKLG